MKIMHLEANDSIFEFVLPEYLRQDGSGEKGFERFNLDFGFHVERDCPQSFPQKLSLLQTPRRVLAS
jgi:hypothetical protein